MIELLFQHQLEGLEEEHVAEVGDVLLLQRVGRVPPEAARCPAPVQVSVKVSVKCQRVPRPNGARIPQGKQGVHAGTCA